MDSSPLNRATSSFCSSLHDPHYHSSDHDPFHVDEISVFLHQFLLRHPPSSSSYSSPPPPFTVQTQATLLDAGSSVLDTPRYDSHVHFQGWFGGNFGDVSSNGGGNELSNECEAESEEAPADDLLPSPPKPPRGSSSSKRTRAAEVHNLSEKRRRSRINEKMKALQKLIPNSNKTDKASMLDEAIEYLKQLQLQVQVLSMRNGVGGLNRMCHDNSIAESFLQQQTAHPFPANSDQFGRDHTIEPPRLVMNAKAKAEAASAMDEHQYSLAAATGVFNLGRQTSSRSNMANPVTHSMFRSSYVSY